MNREWIEFLVFRIVFVLVATLMAAGIGALFSWHWALGLGLAQFVVVMLVTREREPEAPFSPELVTE